MEHVKTHLDYMKENLSFEELLEVNDLDHEEVLRILHDLGYLLYPEDRTLYPEEMQDG